MGNTNNTATPAFTDVVNAIRALQDEFLTVEEITATLDEEGVDRRTIREAFEFLAGR